jgi:hypothetical protein
VLLILAQLLTTTVKPEEHKYPTPEEICEQKFQFYMYVKNSTNVLYRNIL